MVAPLLPTQRTVLVNAPHRHFASRPAIPDTQTAVHVPSSVAAQQQPLEVHSLLSQQHPRPAAERLSNRVARLYPPERHDAVAGNYALLLTHLTSRTAAQPDNSASSSSINSGSRTGELPGGLEESLAELIEARPAVLDSRSQLQGTIASASVIAQHLHVGTAQALRILSSAPQLLGMGPDVVAERLALTFELMDITAPAVRRLLASFPHLLNLSPHMLAGHFDGTRDFLGLGQPAMQALVLKWPGILTLDPQQCMNRLNRLCTVLGQRPKAVMAIIKRCPLMLSQASTQSPETLTHKLSHLSALLGLSQEELERVVYTYPTLLLCASATVTHNASHLAQLLHLPGTQALRPLISRMPNLLGFSGATLAEKLGSLQQAMGLSRDMVVAMAASRPAVLASSSERLRHTWTTLRQLASTHPAWQEKLEAGELRVSTLGLLVTVSERRLQRLRYLAAEGLQGSCQITTAVTLTDVVFLAKFPSYEQWQQKQRQEEQHQPQLLLIQQEQQQRALQEQQKALAISQDSSSVEAPQGSPASASSGSSAGAARDSTVVSSAPRTHASRLRAAISNRTRSQPPVSPSSSLVTASSLR